MRIDLWEQPVSYAAVGATKADDLLVHPPVGYRPIERRVRIGHGDARFTWAWTAAMTWGVQTGSGFSIRRVDAPAEVTANTYAPVEFAADGTPVKPASTGVPADVPFGPDGEPFLAAGDTALLSIPFLLWHVKAPVRVVYVVDEPDRKGFGYGTLKGHPEDGEEAWLVERMEDGSVWLRIRAFSRPSTTWWWLVYPVLRMAQEFYTRRYERALAVPIGAESPGL
jgi:uncharacterized protein (UPF0548 family)